MVCPVRVLTILAFSALVGLAGPQAVAQPQRQQFDPPTGARPGPGSSQGATTGAPTGVPTGAAPVEPAPPPGQPVGAPRTVRPPPPRERLSPEAASFGEGEQGRPAMPAPIVAAPSFPAPAFPAPAVGEDASPQQLLDAARRAINSGNNRAALEAMERAQTRLLDRSTLHLQTDRPSDSPIVKEISAASRALAGGDRASALRGIDAALGMFR